VECEVAGGIVADYRVVESWKGPPRGSRLRISQALDVWEPTFPIALCGERYLILARPAAGVGIRLRLSGAVGRGQPLWWRRIPAPYTTDLDYPPIRLNELGLPERAWALPGRSPSVEAFRDSVRSFLSIPSSTREVMNLRPLAEWVLARPADRAHPEKDSAEVVTTKEVDRLDIGETLSLVVGAVRRNSRDTRYVAARLGSTGGEQVMSFLRSEIGREVFGSDTAAVSHPIRMIKARRGEATWEPDPLDSLPPAPDDSTRLRLRAALGGSGREAARAFDVLAVHDPSAVVEFLLSYQVPETSPFNRDTEYLHGCYFGWRCGPDRASHFRRLLEAKDPHVRVAAAVYLTFEDAASGEAALRQLSLLAGPPGGWAALALAGRGDETAVPRAIQLFAEPLDGTVGTIYIGNLKKRLLVLLSNSAHASGVKPPPSMESEDQYYPFADRFARWWQEVGPQVKLRDPWRAVLSDQKVE
jgi:hypothetical protein